MPIYKGAVEITSGNLYKGSTEIENGYKAIAEFYANETSGYLIVGGGSSGSKNNGRTGGGGAGGEVINVEVYEFLTNTNYVVMVGNGGPNGTASGGGDGYETRFNIGFVSSASPGTVTTSKPGLQTPSSSTLQYQDGGDLTTSIGPDYVGGNGYIFSTGTSNPAGGGGGAGAAGNGSNASGNTTKASGGNGGIGKFSSITGAQVGYGGGCGGGSWGSQAPLNNTSGVIYGAGQGGSAFRNPSQAGTIGQANRGGGGSGADQQTGFIRAGGSGVVILKIRSSDFAGTVGVMAGDAGGNDSGYNIATVGNFKIITFTSAWSQTGYPSGIYSSYPTGTNVSVSFTTPPINSNGAAGPPSDFTATTPATVTGLPGAAWTTSYTVSTVDASKVVSGGPGTSVTWPDSIIDPADTSHGWPSQTFSGLATRTVTFTVTGKFPYLTGTIAEVGINGLTAV